MGHNLPRNVVVVLVLSCLVVSAPAQTIHERLVMAAVADDIVAARDLLSQGASVYKVLFPEDGDGFDMPSPGTAVYFATLNGNVEMVALLLAYGANDRSGLELAVRSGNVAIAWMLIVGGGSVIHRPDYSDPYPFILDAVETEHLEMVKLLVKLGSPVNWDGEFRGQSISTRQLAEQVGNQEIIAYLESKGLE